MHSVFNALSAANKQRSLFVAVSMYNGGTSGFCLGSFPAVSNSEWPTAWGMAQRDVVMMYKPCGGDWKVYCKFSMNTYDNDFAGVVQKLLTETRCSNSTSTPTPATPAATSAGILQCTASAVMALFLAMLACSVA